MRSILAAALLLAAPALAEDEAPKADEKQGPNIEKAIELPVAADKLRKHGVPDKDVKEAIKAAKDKDLDAGETAEVLEEADEAVKEHGPIDNMGAFVKAQLEEGKRGKELAAAIREEHKARGKGKPDHAGGVKGGKPDGKGGKAGQGGRPDGKGGKPDGKGGRPEGKGMPAGKGGKGGGQ